MEEEFYTQIIKPVDELEFSDDFMFCTIMQNEEICKEVLERLLKIKIKKLEYPEAQKTINPFYMSKGIRLDVYCEDDGKIYDIEMQNRIYKELPKRARYYQSMIDSEALEKGKDYKELKESYIIFITMKDPFEQGLPEYQIKQYYTDNTARTTKIHEYNDGVHKVFYNTSAWEKAEDKNLQKFLKFVYTTQAQDSLTAKIENQIKNTRKRQKFRSTYMEWLLHYNDAKYEGLQQGLQQGITQSTRAIACNAIAAGLAKDVVIKITGLSETEYEQIEKDVFVKK